MTDAIKRRGAFRSPSALRDWGRWGPVGDASISNASDPVTYCYYYNITLYVPRKWWIGDVGPEGCFSGPR